MWHITPPAQMQAHERAHTHTHNACMHMRAHTMHVPSRMHIVCVCTHACMHTKAWDNGTPNANGPCQSPHVGVIIYINCNDNNR